jgi:hypothetical protein
MFAITNGFISRLVEVMRGRLAYFFKMGAAGPDQCRDHWAPEYSGRYKSDSRPNGLMSVGKASYISKM